MAYTPHAYIAFQGGWAGSAAMANEVWQFGVRLYTGAAAGGQLADPQTYVDAVGPDLVTWFHSSAGRMSADARLDMIKCNNIDAAGHYQDPVTHEYVPPANTVGGAVTQVPAFCTLVWTWETGFTRGKARRGRIYPPNMVDAIVDLVNIGNSERTNQRTSAHQLLTILNINEPTGGLLVSPVIASRSDGTVNLITGISVDDVYDVQRRRKNRALGVRSSVLPFP